MRGAVIGTGSVARLRHIPAVRGGRTERDLAELVAICDPVTTALNEAGEQAGIGGRYRDYREVLARDDIDVVMIATPNSLA